MARGTSLSTARKYGAVLAIFVIGAACSAGDSWDTNAFLLRSEEVDLQEATGQVVDALVSAFQTEGLLQSEYPVLGHVATAPDPADPEAKLMACAEGRPDDSEAAACILLNQAGDFVRVQPITWPSAAFYMYKIYVMPRSLFARVDPVKDFVAIDVYLMQEPGLWEAVAQAMRDAADHLGARPFRP